MTNIFINYRRSDASGYAGRLHDRLASRCGPSHVFIDVDNIEPGEDFARAIDSIIDKADVVLVLIGKGWLQAADANGRPRLHTNNDYVRIEIATALRRAKVVIPLLVGGAAMPGEHELPAELRPLATRHAYTCSDGRFHADVDTLIDKIDRKPGTPPKARAKPVHAAAGMASFLRRWLRRGMVAMAVLGGIVYSGAMMLDLPDQRAARSFVTLKQSAATASPRLATTRDSRLPPYSDEAALLRSEQIDLARRRVLMQQQLDEIQRRYNTTARSIIDSMGR